MTLGFHDTSCAETTHVWGSMATFPLVPPWLVVANHECCAHLKSRPLNHKDVVQKCYHEDVLKSVGRAALLVAEGPSRHPPVHLS